MTVDCEAHPETPIAEATGVLAELDWPALDPGDDAHFLTAAREVERRLDAEADAARAGLLRTMDAILRLTFDQKEAAECPFWHRSVVDSLDAGALGAIAESADAITCPVIRAFVLDVAWYRRACSYDRVEAVVDAYLAHARAVLDPHRWSSAFRFLRRAAALAASLGRGRPLHSRALAEVRALIVQVGEGDPLYFCAKAMQLLQEHRYPDTGELSALAGRLAELALAGGDHWRALALLEVKERWNDLARDVDAGRATRIEIARLLETQAQAAADRAEPLIATTHQIQAVEAWRRVGGEPEAVRAARVKLQALQREGAGTLKGYEVSIDLSHCVAQARDRVTGKSGFDAVVALVTLKRSHSVETLREQARIRLGEHPLQAVFQQRALNSFGRTVYPRPSVLDSVEQAITDATRSDLATTQQIFALGGVAPAAQQIQLEHGVTASDLLGLVARSPFVPKGRERSFARGLALGFQGEFWLAAHTLMPQFENAVRRVLEDRGAVVSTLPASGEQNEIDLGGLLELPEAVEVFGQDELFVLRSLLVEKSGTNLRNELSHGLIDDGAGEAFYIYFWWKTLQYVLMPLLALAGARSTDQGDESTQA
ncbi:MAG: DUF4209 domain-containing protein [Myxococcales bacterium]|nr:DUF4209 domain-containing protein [Myxococcales bacterium]